jgi:hypothetical protein
MAPLVVKDKVLVGNSGGELGVRGWLVALDTRTGKEAWRAWSTGPDSEVLIGPDFKPFYAADRGKDLGKKSWPGEAWKIGGGNVWGWISYDPQADLIYYGTANPGPWNPEQRPGANKWTSGIFARSPDDGQARWFYQYSPHDLHDYDGVNENILLDMSFQGRQRKLLVHPDRNGYVYVMDRLNGQVLSAEPFVHITTTEGVDLSTGQLKYNPQKAAAGGPGDPRDLPGVPGRQGLAAIGVVAAHRAAVHPAPEPVPGHRDLRRLLHRRHALRRRRQQDVRRAGRQARPVHGLGRGRRPQALVDSRALPGVERGAGDRRRRGFLRHHGRLVQGRRRAQRRAAVAVQDRLRHHRPADRLPRAGRQAVRGDPGRGRRLGRRHRVRRPRCARRHRRQAASSMP